MRRPSTCPFFAPRRAEEEPGVRPGGASVAEQPLSVKRRSFGEPGDGEVSYQTTFGTIMQSTPMRRAGDRTRRTTSTRLAHWHRWRTAKAPVRTAV